MLHLIRCPEHRRRKLVFYSEETIHSVQGRQISEIVLSRNTRLPVSRLVRRYDLLDGTVLFSQRLGEKQIRRFCSRGVRIAEIGREKEMLQNSFLLSAAVQMLELADIPFAHRVLGIADPQLRHRELIERAVQRLAQVRIWTCRLDAARQLQQYLMDEYGAPVLFGEEPEILRCSGVILSPEDVEIPLPKVPVLTPEKPETVPEQPVVLYHPLPQMPSDCLPLLEEGEIDPMQLLGALVSSERCWKLRTLPCESLLCSGEKISVRQAARFVHS